MNLEAVGDYSNLRKIGIITERMSEKYKIKPVFLTLNES